MLPLEIEGVCTVLLTGGEICKYGEHLASPAHLRGVAATRTRGKLGGGTSCSETRVGVTLGTCLTRDPSSATFISGQT